VHLSLSGGAGKPRPRREHHHVSANSDEQGDKGVWMSVWVDDVDEIHRQSLLAAL